MEVMVAVQSGTLLHALRVQLSFFTFPILHILDLLVLLLQICSPSLVTFRVTVETSKRNQIRNKHGFGAGFVSPKQTSSCVRAFPRFAKRNEGTDRSVCFDVFA